MKLVECVPNFSEGRDQKIIDGITAAIASVDGVKLLDVDPGSDTNRTVVTFVGSPEAVLEGAFQGIRAASELIDMRRHSGAHARMGATDVCPFVPVSGVTADDCIVLAKRLGERVGSELNIPVYLYEQAASAAYRRNLADVRAGEYEGLPDKLKDPRWQPDFGSAEFNSKSGATVIGVREFLIAYNINLNTRDRKPAHDIALTIREKGRAKRDAAGKIIRDENGAIVRNPGLLKACKAVGWVMEAFNCAQISINLTDYHITPPHEVFDVVCKEAEKRGLRVTGSELVGLIPLEALLMAGEHYLCKQGKPAGFPEAERIRMAVQSLGLNELTPFDPAKKIIEYQVRDSEKNLLRDMALRDFADELSIDSPAPGGGSVSALSGAMAAGLASMVAHLTVGKKGYEANWDRCLELPSEAQRLKDELLRAIDDDTDAFNGIMHAMRLPKKTDEQKSVRADAIETATKTACEVPLRVMERALDAMKLCLEMKRNGNRNSASDAEVGVLQALAAVEGAGRNVLINLDGIRHEAYKTGMRAQVDNLLNRARKMASEI